MDDNQKPLTKDELTDTLKEERGEFVKLIKKEISMPIGEKIDNMGEKIDNLENLYTKLDIKFDEKAEEIKTDFSKSKNEILNSNDKLMGELKKKNQEEAAHSLSHHQIKDSLDEHDKRLKAIEPQPA